MVSEERRMILRTVPPPLPRIHLVHPGDLGENMARLGPEIAETVRRSLAKGLGHLRRARPQIVKFGFHLDKHQLEDTAEQRVPMAAGETLRLRNKLGNVTVQLTDGAELVVTARRRASRN